MFTDAIEVPYLGETREVPYLGAIGSLAMKPNTPNFGTRWKLRKERVKRLFRKQ